MEKAGTKQNKRVKIAITGGIGSGKSLIGDILQKLGYPVFSCDEIYREMKTDAAYLSALESIFNGVVKDGVLDKQRLSKLVFSDPNQLKRLNELSHPLIMQKLYEQMEKYPVSFAEVPLLFESGRTGDFDDIIVVYRKKEERIDSVCARDNLTPEDVLSRIKNQADYEKIIQEGHTVIYNDGDVSSLKEKVIKTLEKILR